MTNNTDSWGRLDQKPRASLPGAQWVTAASRERASPVLPFGNGRSYGDSCHCDTGHLLLPHPPPHSIHLNQETGLLRADAGVLLKDVLEVSAGTGWFPPVLPGTKYVTLGGAVANDIHGKNHAHHGTFGRHIVGFGLTRSDRKAVWCSKAENAALFGATIGGMGLTGLIGEIELQMMAASSHAITTRNQPFETLEGFFTLVDEAEAANEYCVAWVDSLASNKRFGRGIIISGNHAAQDDQSAVSAKTRRLSVPFTPPVPLVAGQALKAFNELYFRSNAAKRTTRIVSANSFFFPLDAIGHWNRLYGPKGLFQHQSVLPAPTAHEAVGSMLRAAQKAGQGSFLTVLKKFGDLESPGLLSFPAPGFTLTLDFPNRGAKTLALLDTLDAITCDHGGRVNPYKDARMDAKTFQLGFPNWRDLERHRDPVFLSDFWKRVTKPLEIIAPPLAPSLEDQPVNQTAKGRVHKPDLTSSGSAKPDSSVSSSRQRPRPKRQDAS